MSDTASAGGEKLLAALDIGTSSTRICLFDRCGNVVSQAQLPFEGQTNPRPGWCEHDPNEIIASAKACIAAMEPRTGDLASRIECIGLTNHRETTVAWSRSSGEPLCNAIVWLDARTESTVAELVARAPGHSADAFRQVCGLPIASYFSAVKMRWLLDNVPAVAEAGRSGDLMLGTVDAWFLYRSLGVHVTDVTNASRTMLMSLRTLDWDDGMLEFFGIDRAWLPRIMSSSEVYGALPENAGWGPLEGVRVSGCLGDQQAALVGQMCFSPGMAKSTYGTGAFLLSNTGTQCVTSGSGLLTTVAYRFGPDAEPHYALEGSIAVAGAAVNWLRDGLGVIDKASQLDEVCRTVDDAGGVCFVPAFSGLLAPHWDGSARGAILGITQHTTRAHICRATVEAVAFQTREVLDCMTRDTAARNGDADGAEKDADPTTGNDNAHEDAEPLSIDGGMTASNLLCQTLASTCRRPVVRSEMAEATALGAAYAAAIGVGYFTGTEEIARCANRKLETFRPDPKDAQAVESGFKKWARAIERSKGWDVSE